MFANKVVLITGGSSGIGAAAAECFAKEGANLTIVGRNEANLTEVAYRCEKLDATVLTIKADVSKDDQVKTIVEKTIEKFGKLDVLVNNAGIIKLAGILDSNVLDIFDEVINTNLRSIIQLTNLAVPYLKETKGNIINVSSVASRKILTPGSGAYCMSKAALDHFTRCTAIELAPFKIRVNCINPGPVITNISRDMNVPASLASIDDVTLLGRISEASEIGELILYVASDKARGITGSCLLSDNGATLK